MYEPIQPKTRLLKVAEVGDFWHKRTRPQIRLEGKWLAQAGIPPHRYVRVENPMPGVLVIQLVEEKG